MPFSLRRMRRVAMFALLGLFWVTPAAATSFTATWNVAPITSPDPPPPSPFYDCPGWGGGGLICTWLWDQGLEVRSQTHLPMYGDGGPFYDAFGTEPPIESDIVIGGGLLGIAANCRTDLEPCISTFTPRTLVFDLFDESGEAGVFFTSSRGGLITTLSGLPVNFAGAEWTDITWMDIGIYLPDACVDCQLGELGLSLQRLTFDATAVPEPASTLLIGTGLLALLRRSRRCQAAEKCRPGW